VLATVYQGSMHHIPVVLVCEWSEVVAISVKLAHGEELDERDRLWVRELVAASGWRENDLLEELENIDVDPSERVERYRELFENYCREALQHMVGVIPASRREDLGSCNGADKPVRGYQGDSGHSVEYR